MDTLRNPTGPLPPSTYWRRRVLLLGVLLLVLVGVVWACRRDSGAEQKPTGALSTPSSGLPTIPSDTATPTPTPTPTTTRSGTGTPTGTASTPGPTSPKPSTSNGKVLCPVGDLRVSVRADQKFYSPKQQPKFTLILVNVHKTSCYVDLGSKALGVTVFSGKDRVWSTMDCAKGPAARLHKLPSGGVYTTSATWDWVRSVKGCAKTSVTAQPGYYVLDGQVGKATPKNRAVFVLQKN